MGERGPAKKPSLQIVREGNPGKRAIPKTLELPPATLDEPDWFAWFPATADNAFDLEDDDFRIERRVINDELCRETASRTWTAVYGMLDQQGLIADVDLEALTDYCVCVGRLLQCERDLSLRGMSWSTERGEMANPSVRAANLYRTSMRNYSRKLGLTPSDRNGLGQGNGAGRGKEGSTFDI